MEITIEKLLEGKSTRIKSKEYLKTSDYVSPFLEEMGKFTKKFIVNVKLPSQVTKTEGSDDLTYNRVSIMAVMPNTVFDKYHEVYGLVYALDIKKPVYKTYRGLIDDEMNFYVFNPTWIVTQELKPSEKFNINIKSLMEFTSDCAVKINTLNTTILSPEAGERHRRCGLWVEQCIIGEYTDPFGNKVKLSPMMAVEAHTNIYIDSSNKNYTSGKELPLMTAYQAFANIIRDDSKDILNRFEKTILINSLFKL